PCLVEAAHFAEDDRFVVERLPLLGRFGACPVKCSERVAELATLLVTDADVGAQAGIFTDDERALEIADRLRELGRIHIHSAELREGVVIQRIALDRRVQLRYLLADGVYGIALWRTVVLGGVGRGRVRTSTCEVGAD